MKSSTFWSNCNNSSTDLRVTWLKQDRIVDRCLSTSTCMSLNCVFTDRNFSNSDSTPTHFSFRWRSMKGSRKTDLKHSFGKSQKTPHVVETENNREFMRKKRPSFSLNRRSKGHFGDPRLGTTPQTKHLIPPLTCFGTVSCWRKKEMQQTEYKSSCLLRPSTERRSLQFGKSAQVFSRTASYSSLADLVSSLSKPQTKYVWLYGIVFEIVFSNQSIIVNYNNNNK